MYSVLTRILPWRVPGPRRNLRGSKWIAIRDWLGKISTFRCAMLFTKTKQTPQGTKNMNPQSTWSTWSKMAVKVILNELMEVKLGEGFKMVLLMHWKNWSIWLSIEKLHTKFYILVHFAFSIWSELVRHQGCIYLPSIGHFNFCRNPAKLQPGKNTDSIILRKKTVYTPVKWTHITD